MFEYDLLSPHPPRPDALLLPLHSRNLHLPSVTTLPSHKNRSCVCYVSVEVQRGRVRVTGREKREMKFQREIESGGEEEWFAKFEP